MDFSKLPKISETSPTNPPPISDIPGSSAASTAPPTSSNLAEAWFGIAIGIILLFLFPHLLQYLLHPSRTDFDATDTQTGQVIPYIHSAFFWPDLGVTFFCITLIVDSLLMLIAPRRPVVICGFALSALCAALNAWIIFRSMNILGFQVVCALAVAFSVFIAIQRWAMLRR